MVNLPPSGIASRALTARLRIAASSSAGSASTGQTPPAPTISSDTSSPSARRRKSDSPLSRRLTSIAAGLSGCWRANANSRLVKVAARSAPCIALAMCRLQIADDDGEQVVEVMGDAAGQVADGIESLRLP